MLIRAEKTITKEQYDRAQLNGGFVTEADLQEIFNQSELYAYGVYSPIACKRDDSYTGETIYYMSYATFTTCG